MKRTYPISGLANCHLPGLYSLVLKERTSPEDGMHRVFYAGRDCKMGLMTDGDFTLKPHTHRQNIRLTRISGEPENVRFERARGMIVLHRYRFSSALLGGTFGVKYEQSEFFGACRFGRIPDDGVSLAFDEIHTVVAKPGDCWEVREGSLAPTNTPDCCWSLRRDMRLDNTGLYRQMGPEEIAAVWEEADRFFDKRVAEAERAKTKAE